MVEVDQTFLIALLEVLPYLIKAECQLEKFILFVLILRRLLPLSLPWPLKKLEGCSLGRLGAL